MVEQKPPLGLSHNPFSSPQGGFFDGGDRGIYLEKLRHLSRWARRVLLVTGPRDAGKTMIFRQLSASLEPRAKAARINAALVNAPREVLASVVQGFGLAAPADAQTQLLADLIVGHVADQDSHQRFCVVLVDDAELLDGRALEQLLSLVGRCPVRLALFGDVRIAPLVERAARNLEVDWHEMRLSGFNLNDVRAYLEWRFEQARYRGRLPFTEEQVKDMARLSEGMPGRIDQLANVLLARLRSAEAEPERPRFPALHRSIVAVLVVLMVLAYLLLRTPATDAPTEVQPLELPAPRGPEVAKPDLSKPDGMQAPGAGSDIAASEGSGTAPAEQGDSEPETLRRGARQSSPQAAAAVPETAPQAAGTDEAPREPSEVAPRAETAGAAPVAAPASAPASAPAAAPKGADWILRQPGDHFTLQLLSSGSSERAAAYVARRSRPADFAVYRISRGGRLLHVVVYGSFASRAAAERAALNSEATAEGVKPWLRTFSQVQDAVRTTPQG